jgi:hypothetical protein
VPVPLDEYPIHQGPQTMKHFVTSDRNVYDRCIMHALSRDGEGQVAVGLGVYPHVGVIDCYVAARDGRRLSSLRTSGALGDDRMQQVVGPMRIEVVQGLQTVRFVCDDDGHGITADLTWEGSFPAIDEPRHIKRQGDNVILDAFRFVQTATVTGSLVVDGKDLLGEGVDWVGARDRSWGTRPVGEATAPGKPHEPAMWWCWIPLRFDDFALMFVLEEKPDGYRTINEAVRVWPDGRIEQLGWAEPQITYRSGTRYPTAATIGLKERGGRELTLEIEPLGPMPLSVGLGYGPDDDGWNHGRWMGEAWTQRVDHDLDAEAVQQRVAWSMIDHAARATLDDQVGYGIFEHMALGRHEPSGFTDLMAVAP